MSSVYLKTPRLLVRRLLPGDAMRFFECRSHPEIARFQTSYSVEQATSFIEELTRSEPTEKKKWFQFGIELANEGTLIGDIGFLNTDENGKAWIGFTLDPAHWKQGYASEAVSAVLAYYASMGISEVWASVAPKNKASTRLLARLGFRMLEIKPDDMIFKKTLP